MTELFDQINVKTQSGETVNVKRNEAGDGYIMTKHEERVELPEWVVLSLINIGMALG